MSNNSYYNDQWRIINEPNQNKVSNYSMDFDGSSDFINCGDSDNLSFGNGSTDSPFSISAWVNMTDATSFVTIAKDATSNREYVIRTLTDDKLYFYLLDNVNGGYIGRISSGTVTSYQGTWIHTVYTYNGNSSSSGIKIYLNGSAVDNADYQGGSYTAMSNTTTSLNIGRQESGVGTFANGQIDQVTVFDYELPATGTNSVATLYGGGTAITNPMSLSPKPIAYYQLGDQSVSTGPTSSYLVPNKSLSDYVFNFVPSLVNFGTTIFNFDRTDPFTFSIWIKTSSNGTNQYVISKQIPNYLGYMFLLDSSLKIGAVFSHNSNARIYFVSNSAIPSNEWVHLVWTYSGNSLASGMSVYANGAPFAITTVDDNLTSSPTNSGQLNISGRDGSFHREVNGELSNFSIFDTELSSTQVETLYNNGAPGDISSLNPNGWWKLNAADTFDSSTSTWTITDYGSGGNDGTSSGMTSANLVVSDLQQTSGYSPYSLSLDGVDNYLDANSTFNTLTSFTVSAWFKADDTAGTVRSIVSTRVNGIDTSKGFDIYISANVLTGRVYNNGATEVVQSFTDTTSWHNVVMTYNGTTLELFLDNLSIGTATGNYDNSGGRNLTIGKWGPVSATSYYFDGLISNVSIFNTELTSTQVTEIYNQGVPSNLNTFSGTKPIAWWQLGSNSSFNTNWTCLDEIGTNNAVSANMTNDDIVDGVGYSASGIGTSSIDIKGNAPYSTANGLSENMDVLDRTTDIPS